MREPFKASQGGFSSLVLSLPGGGASPASGNLTVGVGYVTFAGNTTLQLPNQVVINAGTILVPFGASDIIRANYFQWNNSGLSPAVPLPFVDGTPLILPSTPTGQLSIIANTVDLIGMSRCRAAKIPPLRCRSQANHSPSFRSR